MKRALGIHQRWLGLLLAVLLGFEAVSARPQHTQFPPGTPETDILQNQISEMLGAWQIGDVNLLKSYYADDVMVVSGEWEPALIGWAKYMQAYLQQRKRMTNVRMDRFNTFLRVQGNAAWATYQWDFSAMVDGRVTRARGQTSLVFQKRDANWLIVLNHTSLVGEAQTQTPHQSAPPQKPPAKPAV